MKNLLLTSILLLISSVLLAQNVVKKGDIAIRIRMDDVWGQTHFIDVSEKAEKATILSKRMDYTPMAVLRKDSGYATLLKNYSKYPVAEAKAKLDGFYLQYSKFYSITVSIDLKTDHQYNDILKLLTTSSKAKLEKNHEKKDIVMDSSDVRFVITTDEGTKNVYAEGLFDQRYPILSNFVNLTYSRVESVKQK